MVEAIRQGDIPGVQLRCRRALPLAPAAAWRWLVEPERLARWLGDRVEVEAGGGGLVVAGDDEEGQALAERGRTLELSPPERWVLAFQRTGAGWPAATRLTLEVLPAPGGCELSILQHGFQHLPLSACMTIWEFYRRRWRRALERLARACAEREK
jgi:uncharacterized protein YndB with AHSA1/START domain